MMIDKIKCFFGFHDWTKWEIFAVTRDGGVPAEQSKTCKRCNLMESRYI